MGARALIMVLLQTVSGVTPLTSTPETEGPRGQSAPPSDVEGHPRGEPLPDKPSLTQSQRRLGTEDRIQNPVCGVTSLHPMLFDPSGPTAMEVPGSGLLGQPHRVPLTWCHGRPGLGTASDEQVVAMQTLPQASPPFTPCASRRIHPRQRSRSSSARRIRHKGEL